MTINIEESDEQECSGRIYRAELNNFINRKREYVSQIRMVPVKRKSCSGCIKCGYIDAYLSDDVANGPYPTIPDNVQDAELYILIGKIAKDAYAVDCNVDLEFVRVS